MSEATVHTGGIKEGNTDNHAAPQRIVLSVSRESPKVPLGILIRTTVNL